MISEEDLLKNIALLQSENALLKTLMEEYKLAADARETAWREMSLKTFNNIPLQSNLDNRSFEIKNLHEQVRDLQQKIEGGFNREYQLAREADAAAQGTSENEDLKSKLHYLQSEMTELSEQVKRMYNQNAVLQNYVGRIAELESLLANSEDEINRLKEEKRINE
jgi:predicted nuclease with TOPRIM domain